MPTRPETTPAAEGPFIRLLVEIVDAGANGDSATPDRHLSEACRLLEADVLYTVTPADAAWRKMGVGPDGVVAVTRLERLAGIVRNVLTRRSRFLEARLIPHGPFLRHWDGWPGIDTGSYIAVPLQHRGTVSGALVLLRASGRASFTGEDLDRVESLARALAARAAIEERLAELDRKARTDPLTRLANYLCLREELARAIHAGRPMGESFAIVMADVDNLRRINDRYGHLAGSDVLRRVARVLERSVRAGDLVAKYGGDEFIILLRETTREGAATAAQRIRETVAREVSGPTRKDPISCSCGIALFPDDGTDYAGLITAADRDLVRAKLGGRDPLTVEEPEGRRAA